MKVIHNFNLLKGLEYSRRVKITLIVAEEKDINTSAS